MAVTVRGPANTSVTVTTGSGDILDLATQISNALATIESAGAFAITTVSGAGLLPPAINPDNNELQLSGPGGVNGTIPAGYNYVINVGSTSSTLSGNNVTIFLTM